MCENQIILKTIIAKVVFTQKNNFKLISFPFIIKKSRAAVMLPSVANFCTSDILFSVSVIFVS